VIVGAVLVVRECGALIKVLAIPVFLLGAGVATALGSIAPLLVTLLVVPRHKLI
jgi:hypothetical protein